MKISEMHITPIALGDPPLLNASGVHQPWALRSIIEVHAFEKVGLGETYGDAPHLALLQKVDLVGLDPFDLNGLWRRVQAAVGDVDSPDKHGLTGASSAENNSSPAHAAISAPNPHVTMSSCTTSNRWVLRTEVAMASRSETMP